MFQHTIPRGDRSSPVDTLLYAALVHVSTHDPKEGSIQAAPGARRGVGLPSFNTRSQGGIDPGGGIDPWGSSGGAEARLGRFQHTVHGGNRSRGHWRVPRSPGLQVSTQDRGDRSRLARLDRGLGSRGVSTHDPRKGSIQAAKGPEHASDQRVSTHDPRKGSIQVCMAFACQLHGIEVSTHDPRKGSIQASVIGIPGIPCRLCFDTRSQEGIDPGPPGARQVRGDRRVSTHDPRKGSIQAEATLDASVEPTILRHTIPGRDRSRSPLLQVAGDRGHGDGLRAWCFSRAEGPWKGESIALWGCQRSATFRDRERLQIGRGIWDARRDVPY